MYLYVRGIHFDSFYDFDILFWNCSDSVVFLEFFRQCHVSVVFSFLFFILLHSSKHKSKIVVSCGISLFIIKEMNCKLVRKAMYVNEQ